MTDKLLDAGWSTTVATMAHGTADEAARAYEDYVNSLFEASVEKQLPVDRASQKALLAARTAIFNKEVSKLAEQVYTGDVTIGQWEETMRRMIREMHSSVAAISKGGWDNMDYSDWGKLGAWVKKQYKYLHGFAEDIDANRETISLGAIDSRARMYGEAAKGAAIMISTPVDILSQLPWLPKDGSTECLVNCKCLWLLSVTKVGRKTKTVRAVWRLSEAEHCVDCMDRSGHVVWISVPASMDVPLTIGGM